jgi:hypothetical protein
MALDLETTRVEVLAYLQQTGMAVFHGYHRMLDSLLQVAWDVDEHPDFREFLDVARKVGAKLIVFNSDTFSQHEIDDALEQLEDSDFTREEKRSYEARLRQLQAYEGFTCGLQVSFNLENRLYVYELHAEWYEALTDIVNELDAASGDEEEDEEDGAVGGYFSNN